MTMSKRAEDYIYRLGMDQHIIQRQLDGLQESDLFLQSQPRGNCANWVLGHIVHNRQVIMRKLGQETFWTCEQEALYQTDSEPITSQDSPHLPLEHLLNELKRSEEMIVARLESITDDELDVLDEADTTLGKTLNFRIWHEGYHVGQFEVLRQLTGVNDKVI